MKISSWFALIGNDVPCCIRPSASVPPTYLTEVMTGGIAALMGNEDIEGLFHVASIFFRPLHNKYPSNPENVNGLSLIVPTIPEVALIFVLLESEHVIE